ncbi:MAG: 50S ribosomal protein L3 [Patescibacteria group bacterium]
MKTVLVTKQGMTQVFTDSGEVIPATVVLPVVTKEGEELFGGLVVGDRVKVSGVTKGKGFQGVVKRHGFKGGSRTHGQKHSEREPGSIGGGLRTRIPKNMRMAGRMGGNRVTVANLSIVALNETEKSLLISGAVPGRRGTKLEIKTNEN